MAAIHISDSIIDNVKSIAAVESTTPEQFISNAITRAIVRAERKHERARKPQAIRAFVKRGDGYIENPIITRQREFDRLMKGSGDEHS